MKKSFFVEIFLPDALASETREALSQILLKIASRFSFLGFEDWEVTLSAHQKVLGVEREFFDLRQWKEPKPRMCAYFSKVKDAKNFSLLVKKSFPELKVGGAREQKPKDWMKEWRKVYRPQKISGKHQSIWVVPAWMKKKNGLSILVNPGQAFGTGTHPTTRLCIKAILDEGDRLPINAKILDFGAGTGVLAIASIVLAKATGKKWRAFGVETDPESLKACRSNAKRNRVKMSVTKKIPRGKFDFIFANVLAPALLEHREDLFAALAPDGAIVCSGILAKEVDEFQRAFFETLPVVSQEGEWASLFFRKI